MFNVHAYASWAMIPFFKAPTILFVSGAGPDLTLFRASAMLWSESVFDRLIIN